MIKFRTILRIPDGDAKALGIPVDAEDAWRGDRGWVYGFFVKPESGQLIVRRDAEGNIWHRDAKIARSRESMHDQIVQAERTRAGWTKLVGVEET